MERCGSMRRRLNRLRKLVAAGAFLALCSAPAAGQQPAPRPSVWDDPERFRALATRIEPWPLRGYPPPARQSVLPNRCRPGERTEIRLGRKGTRLWVEPFPTRVTSGQQRAYQRWLFEEFNKGLACPGDRAFSADSLSIHLAESLNTQLAPRCHRGGLPPDPRPECDRPAGGGWYRTFVLGLPHLIQIMAPASRFGPGDVRDGILDSATRQPDLERRPTRRGNTLLASRGGLVVHGTLLPRLGESSDTAEPFFVDCSFEWERPESVPPPGAGGWKECIVLYRFRGVLDLSYRFYREVFDEPDIPALDLRVRRLVQSMSDGAGALPPAATR